MADVKETEKTEVEAGATGECPQCGSPSGDCGHWVGNMALEADEDAEKKTEDKKADAAELKAEAEDGEDYDSET